jgi:predicted transcriptional regulator
MSNNIRVTSEKRGAVKSRNPTTFQLTLQEQLKKHVEELSSQDLAELNKSMVSEESLEEEVKKTRRTRVLRLMNFFKHEEVMKVLSHRYPNTCS